MARTSLRGERTSTVHAWRAELGDAMHPPRRMAMQRWRCICFSTLACEGRAHRPYRVGFRGSGHSDAALPHAHRFAIPREHLRGPKLCSLSGMSNNALPQRTSVQWEQNVGSSVVILDARGSATVTGACHEQRDFPHRFRRCIVADAA